MRIFVLLPILFCLACAMRVDSSYPVPAIPEIDSQKTSSLHGLSISVQPFLDARLPAIQDKVNVSITQPEGEVEQTVELAFVEALQSQGAVLDGNGEKSIVGEIRRWDSKVAASTSGTIDSNATIYLEVKDAAGKSLFSGEYHGSRSSQFPVIAKQDVGDSLGLAMSEAITQAIRDKNLQRILQ